MMSAIEALEARKQQAAAEPTPQPDPPTSAPQPVPGVVRAPHSSTSAARYSVSLTLDPHVHQYFAEAAEKDERTLAKYLARVLRQIVDEENALARKIEEKKKQDANF